MPGFRWPGRSQPPGAQADAALSAATKVVFRCSPDSARRLSPVMGVTAVEIDDVPDLHATVKVADNSAVRIRTPGYPPIPHLRDKALAVPDLVPAAGARNRHA